MSETGTEKRADDEARQAVDNIQGRFLERIGDRVASGLSMRELSEELIIEALNVTHAQYGCVLRVEPEGSLSLNAVVSREFNGSISRQHDAILNRIPDSLTGNVIKSMKASFSNEAARMLSANLPSCHPRVRSFVLLPIREKSHVSSLLFLANAEQPFDLILVNRLQTMLDAFIRIHLNSIVNQGISNVIADIGQTSRQLVTLLDTTFDGVITIDEYAIITAFNPASERMFGINSDVAMGSSFNNFIPSDVLTNVLDQAERFLGSQQGTDIRPMHLKDIKAIRASGQEFAVEMAVFHTSIGDDVYTTMVVHDVTDRIQSIRGLQDTIVQYETLCKIAPVGIVKLNQEWTCEFANELWCELSGLSVEDTLGCGWVDALHEQDRAQTLKDIHAALKIGDSYRCTARLNSSGQQPLFVCVNATCLMDELGLHTGCLIVIADITDQHLAESRLKQISHKDQLTGLDNRESFLRHLNRSVDTRLPNNPVALLIIGLDGFKSINDSWGHDTGDELLQQVAQRIQQTVRDHDSVARFGGDQFTVLLTTLNHVTDVQSVAISIVEALKDPFQLKKEEVILSTSIGIATLSGEPQTNEDDANSLIKQADVALQRAKSSGRSRHVVFSPELDQGQKDKSALLTSLRRAVDRQDFELYYQPQVLIKEQHILGFEALLRWPQTSGENISPAVFIDVLEETGLIGELGEWALSQACGQHRIWLKKGLISPATTMSVNVSVRQLGMPGFAARVEAILKKHCMRPDSLILEITESAMVETIETDIIHHLKRLGVQISLDDFGTGYSSLAYLSQLPLDHLKIDRSFIADIARNPHATSIVKSIIALANTLGIRVIAEGVEDAGVFPLLLEQGCESYQGYYFSKPLPAREMAARLVDIDTVRLSHYANFIDLDTTATA
ncbi:MAG: diguanylate cyclase (GGDEF)-like protein/PAS domain S-box-containing protein [Granulosicoccus sp.]